MPYQIYKGRDGGYGIMHASRNGVEGYKRAKKAQEANKKKRDSVLSYDEAKKKLMRTVGANNDAELYAIYERDLTKKGKLKPANIKLAGCKTKKEYINKAIQLAVSVFQGSGPNSLDMDNEFGGTPGTSVVSSRSNRRKF